MWADELVQRGIIKRAALDRALEWARQSGGVLQDGLWALGILAERDLLHALAQRYGLQYCTYEKARTLIVSDELLDRVPARFAEANQIVPFRIDDGRTTWLVVRQPLNEGSRESLLRITGTPEVKEILALPAVVKAIIRRHYYREADAFEGLRERISTQPTLSEVVTDRLQLSPEGDPLDGGDSITLNTAFKCPVCAAKAHPNDFQCAGCGYVLNLSPVALGDEPDAPSIVLALLSPTKTDPNKRASRPPEAPAPPVPVGLDAEPVPTVRLNLWPDRMAVPELVASVDVVLSPLSEFEAFLASFIDGRRRLPEIVRDSGLSEIETSIILQSLVDRAVVIARTAFAPAPAAAAEPQSRSPAKLPPPVPPPTLTVSSAASRPPGPPPLPTSAPAAARPPGPPPVLRPGAPRPAGEMTSGDRLRLSDLQRERLGPPVPDAPAKAPLLGDEPPHSTEVRSVLAMALRFEQAGSLDKAVEVLSAAMEKARRPAPLLNRLALVIAQRQDFKTAEKLLKRETALEPKVEAYEKNLFKVLALAAVADL